MEIYNDKISRKKTTKWSLKLSTQRVAILGVFLALTISMKWIFGFLPGIEVVTFLFAMFGLFLPLLDLSLLLTSFILLVMTLYGFGTWELMYFPIFGLASLIPYLCKRWFKNKYVFGLFLLIQGFSVIFWYYLSDLMFFDKAFATANIISALPINLIEGITNMLLGVLFGPLIAHVFNKHKHRFWPNTADFEFKVTKHKLINIIGLIITSITSIGGITTLFFYNQYFLDWRENQIPNSHLLKTNDGYSGPGYLLNNQNYNDIYTQLKDDDAALVVIVDHYKYIHIQHHAIKHKAFDFIWNKDFKISYLVNPGLGAFLKDTYVNEKIISPKNSSPFIFYNHEFGSLGISNYTIRNKDIIEITYDMERGPDTTSDVGIMHIPSFNKGER